MVGHVTTVRPRWTAAAAAAVLVVVGMLTSCDPTPPPAPPSGSGSASTSSASPGSSPTASEEDQAYAAAQKAYTNANRIIDTAVNKGKGSLPKSLNDWADPDGDYYKLQLRGLKGLHDQGVRYDGMSKVVQMFPAEGAVYNPNQISMYACVDGRQVDSVDTSSGDVLDHGGDIVAGVLVFKRTGKKSTDGLRAWRVWGYQNEAIFDVVNECAEAPK